MQGDIDLVGVIPKLTHNIFPLVHPSVVNDLLGFFFYLAYVYVYFNNTVILFYVK